MPILNKNEKYTRELSDRIAVMTGLSSSAVRAVIDGIELCLLDDLRNKARESGVDEKSVILLEIPNIGTLKMHTTKYPKEMSVMLDGRSFKSTFTIHKKFLDRARWAYYGGWDYLTERCSASFKGLFRDHYKSIIQKEEGEQ